MAENKPNNKELWNRAKAAAKAKFDVYPSAYANAWAAKWYKEKGGSWRKAADGGIIEMEEMAEGGLTKWFEEKWVDLGRPKEGGGYEECGRSDADSGKYPKCVPAAKAASMSESEKKSAVARKRAAESDGKGGKPVNVPTMAKKMADGGEVTITPDDMALARRRRRQMEELYPITEKAEGGLIGSMATIAQAIGKEQESPFPEIMQVGMPTENSDAVKIKEPESMAKGGYVVTRSSEREGKTHKVTGPDGTVKFFGDPNLKNRPNNKEAKASWYARHAKSLAKNPHFRAYARSTWAEGGIVPDEIEYFQDGGIGGEGGGGDGVDTSAFDSVTGVDEDVADALQAAGERFSAFRQQLNREVATDKLADETEKGIAAARSPTEVEAVIKTAIPKLEGLPQDRKNELMQVARDRSTELTAAADDYAKLKASLINEAGSLRFLPEGDYAERRAELFARAAELREKDRAEFAKAFGETVRTREGVGEVTTPKASDTRRSPLSQVREEASRLEKYGADYSKYEAFRKQALKELGGDLPLTGNAEEDERNIKRNSFRQRTAESIADDMMASGMRMPQTPVEAVAPAPPSEGTPQPIPPAEPTPPATEPMAATTTVPVAAPAEQGQPAPFVEGSERAARADLAEEQAGLKALAEPTGVLKLLASKGVDINKLEDPAVRYSDVVKGQLSQLGDYQAVYGLARNAKYDDAAAAKIATDEVLRGTGRLGGTALLGPVPSGLGAMEAARETPEYRQAAEAARLQARILQETARIDSIEKKVTADLRNAQIDLELRKASEYEIKKRVLDAQTVELRRQINEARITPQKLFSGNNFIPSAIAVGLDLIGSGLGSKDSVLNYIDGRIAADLNLQIGELNRSKTLLGDLMRQGNDLDDAFKLSQAFYKQVFAMQIEKQTAELGSEKARLQGLATAAKLLQDAAKTQEEVLRKQVDTIYEPYKIRLQNADKGLKGVTDLLKAQIVKPPRPAAAKTPKEPEPAAYLDFTNGVPINTGKWAEVTRYLRRNKMGTDIIDSSVKQVDIKKGGLKFGGKTVDTFTTDPNVYRLAKNPAAAKAVEEADVTAEKFFGALNDLEAIANKLGYRAPAKMDPKDKAVVEKAVADMASYLGGAAFYNIGVPQEAEYQRIKDLVPNLNFFQTGDYGQAKFDAFRKDVGAVILNARNRNLVGGVGGTPPSGSPAAVAAPAMPPPIRKPPVRGP